MGEPGRTLHFGRGTRVFFYDGTGRLGMRVVWLVLMAMGVNLTNGCSAPSDPEPKWAEFELRGHRVLAGDCFAGIRNETRECHVFEVLVGNPSQSRLTVHWYGWSATDASGGIWSDSTMDEHVEVGPGGNATVHIGITTGLQVQLATLTWERGAQTLTAPIGA